MAMNNNHKPANLPAAVRPALQELEPRSVRQATALDEIRAMHEDMQRMSQDLSAAYRELDSRGNRIELLETALQDSRTNERVYRRKLIRLASAMSMIGKLSEEATVIMQSVQEIEEVTAENEAGGTDGNNG